MGILLMYHMDSFLEVLLLCPHRCFPVRTRCARSFPSPFLCSPLSHAASIFGYFSVLPSSLMEICTPPCQVQSLGNVIFSLRSSHLRIPSLHTLDPAFLLLIWLEFFSGPSEGIGKINCITYFKGPTTTWSAMKSKAKSITWIVFAFLLCVPLYFQK